MCNQLSAAVHYLTGAEDSDTFGEATFLNAKHTKMSH